MDKDRFYEVLKYLVYLFEAKETVRTKTQGIIFHQQEKTQNLLRELFESVFSVKYVLSPRNHIASVVGYAKDLHEIKLNHEAFTRLNIIRYNLPEGSRGDTEGFMNDISQNISQYQGFPDSDPLGFKRTEIGDLLGSGAYHTIEANKIIEYHCNRLKEVERDEKGSAVAQDSFETTKHAFLPLLSKESVEDLFRRFDADGTES
jgi:hypothetical protein